jgi:hypothetical protein
MRKLLLITLLLAACDHGSSKPGADQPDPVVESWKKAGLTVSALTSADGTPYASKDCKAGQVNGVDVVLCSYADAKAAKDAETNGFEQVGENTGTALSHDGRMLVIADRRKADPEGRTIDQATKLFIGKDPRAGARSDSSKTPK